MDPASFDNTTHELEEYEDVAVEQMTPEDCLNRAALILTQTSPKALEVSHAVALISLGRELRIGIKNRYTNYHHVEHTVVRVGKRVVEKQRPASVTTGAHSVAEDAAMRAEESGAVPQRPVSTVDPRITEFGKS